jgi:hypothetical protein
MSSEPADDAARAEIRAYLRRGIFDLCTSIVLLALCYGIRSGVCESRPIQTPRPFMIGQVIVTAAS